jgi:hypothetical protein
MNGITTDNVQPEFATISAKFRSELTEMQITVYPIRERIYRFRNLSEPKDDSPKSEQSKPNCILDELSLFLEEMKAYNQVLMESLRALEKFVG